MRYILKFFLVVNFYVDSIKLDWILWDEVKILGLVIMMN